MPANRGRHSTRVSLSLDPEGMAIYDDERQEQSERQKNGAVFSKQYLLAKIDEHIDGLI